MPAKVSFNIELGPDLPNEVMDVARKQGEDPERISSDIQELRNMIFGNLTQANLTPENAVSSLANVNGKQSFTIYLLFSERGICVPPRTDDEFLLRFLRARFFKIETAYNLVRSIKLICIEALRFEF